MGEDIKINEVQQVNDAAYITVLLEDGSLGKNPRNDLIELIRENMPESAGSAICSLVCESDCTGLKASA